MEHNIDWGLTLQRFDGTNEISHDHPDNHERRKTYIVLHENLRQSLTISERNDGHIEQQLDGLENVDKDLGVAT